MKKIKIGIAIIFALGFILRLSFILLAHHGDLNNNISWGTIAYERGFKDLYEGVGMSTRENGEVAWPYSAPNQPPLTILLFSLCRFFWQHLRDFFWYMNWNLLIFPSRLVWFWDEHGMDILVKLPSILADLGIGYLIYKYFASKNKFKIGLILLVVWLFNPLVWYNSSVWGQTDSIVNLLGLIAIFSLLEKKLAKFAIFFTLSFLFKGSLGIFIPLLLFIAIKQKHSLKVWLLSTIYSLLAIILVSIWFHPKLDLFIWLFNLYKIRILPGEIGYLTANSFNYWWLIDSGRVLDNTIYFGLPARMWGFVFTLSGIVLIFKWLYKYYSDKMIFYSLTLTSLVSFLFMTRIHERYLYPFFPVSTILLGLVPSFWPVYIVLSISHLLNLYNLFWAPGIPSLIALLENTWFANTLSFINIIMLIFTLRHLRSAKI